MNSAKIAGQRLLVLDTNILMHDPSAIYRFHEHDIFIPMMVLEELDNHKRGLNEVARNVRQATRTLEGMIADLPHEKIKQGIPISEHNGSLFLQTEYFDTDLPDSFSGCKADNTILATALAVREQFPDHVITLVSKDINLRIKAGAAGVHAEDYYNDKVLEDVSDLPTGLHELPESFWQDHAENIQSWQEDGKCWYRFDTPLAENWQLNDSIFITEDDDPMAACVKGITGSTVTVQVLPDYSTTRNAVWGISAKNREQNFALHLLLDPDIDFVTIQGAAGSGKTLLALAAGLAQCLDKQIYREIIMTRVTIPVGEDIGYLPGTEEEKMTPWMGALMDNLEVLHNGENSNEWERDATNDLLQQRIKIRSLNFMRGRTFLNRYIIIDEAQNLTSKQIKTLITRAGPGSKIVCLGDIGQIDTPYLSGTTSGLTYAIERFQRWQHSGHMTLVRGERSRLADYAAESL